MVLRIPLMLALAIGLIAAGCIDRENHDESEEPEAEDTPASHEWHVLIHPDSGGPYTVEVPFLVADPDDEHAVVALETLRGNMSVIPPHTGTEWMSTPEGYLRISGQGPVGIHMEREFENPTVEHEAFLDWRLPGDEVQATDGGPLEVVWAAEFSGGGRYTCAAQATWIAQVPADGTARLQDENGDGVPEDGQIPAMCV